MKRAQACLLALSGLAGLSGCATYPDERFADVQAGADFQPVTSLSIMTYNIEGLTWPARTGRGPFLERINEELTRMEMQGVLPGVIVFQEAFSSDALRTASRSPHPVFALGPSAQTRSTFPRTDDAVLRRRNILRGEWGIRVFGSGLAIASIFPVSRVAEEPFGPRACAGWDCLSNKGMLLVRIHIPGAQTPIEVVTTHMNSQGSSGVSREKQTAAHRVQSAQLAQFIDRYSNSDNPLVIAGDFNMRGSPARFSEFERHNGYNLARRHCLEAQTVNEEPACEIAMSYDGDEPWMDTQDLQIFDDGVALRLRPVRLEAWFDGDDSGGVLSDHDAYIVTYKLDKIE